MRIYIQQNAMYLKGAHDVDVASPGGIGPPEAEVVEQPDPLRVVADVPVLRPDVEDSAPAAPPVTHEMMREAVEIVKGGNGGRTQPMCSATKHATGESRMYVVFALCACDLTTENGLSRPHTRSCSRMRRHPPAVLGQEKRSMLGHNVGHAKFRTQQNEPCI